MPYAFKPYQQLENVYTKIMLEEKLYMPVSGFEPTTYNHSNGTLSAEQFTNILNYKP